MSDATLLDAALGAFDLFVVGTVDDTGALLLSRDARVPTEETVVFLSGDMENEMTFVEAEQALGSVTWLMEPEPYDPQAAAEIENGMEEAAMSVADDAWDPMLAAITPMVAAAGDPSEEALRDEQEQTVEEAEKRIAQLEGMVAEMMMNAVTDEVFATSSSLAEVVVEDAKVPRFASVTGEFVELSGLMARLAAMGDPEPGTDLEDRLQAVVDRLDKLEGTISEMMDSKIEDDALPEQMEEKSEEPGTLVDETKPGAKTAAYFTNARGIRVWHDPNSGKFAPSGFISPKILAKLWKGDSSARRDLMKAVQDAREAEPGLNLDGAVARVLGPRPSDRTKALHWDSGKRSIGSGWGATRPKGNLLPNASMDRKPEMKRLPADMDRLPEPTLLKSSPMATPDFSVFDDWKPEPEPLPTRVPTQDNYGMFTPEGNKAVGDALRQIEADVAKYRASGKNVNKNVMRAFAVPRFRELKQQYPEVSDTAVRETTGDVLDAILGNYVDSYNIKSWESYELFDGKDPVLPGVGLTGDKWLKRNPMADEPTRMLYPKPQRPAFLPDTATIDDMGETFTDWNIGSWTNGRGSANLSLGYSTDTNEYTLTRASMDPGGGTKTVTGRFEPGTPMKVIADALVAKGKFGSDAKMPEAPVLKSDKMAEVPDGVSVDGQLAWHESEAARWTALADQDILVSKRDGKLQQARLHREAADAIRAARADSAGSVLKSDAMGERPVMRPMDRAMADVALKQMGTWNVMAVSGGRSTLRADGSLDLPVAAGYRVRVSLAGNDTYTVERVFSRGGQDFVKGRRDGVLADELGESVYQASNFRDGPFGDSTPMLQSNAMRIDAADIPESDQARNFANGDKIKGQFNLFGPGALNATIVDPGKYGQDGWSYEVEAQQYVPTSSSMHLGGTYESRPTDMKGSGFATKREAEIAAWTAMTERAGEFPKRKPVTMTPEMERNLTSDTNLSDAVATDVADKVNAGLAAELDNRGIEPGDVEAVDAVWQEMFDDAYYEQTGVRLNDKMLEASMWAYGSNELFGDEPMLKSNAMRVPTASEAMDMPVGESFTDVTGTYTKRPDGNWDVETFGGASGVRRDTLTSDQMRAKLDRAAMFRSNQMAADIANPDLLASDAQMRGQAPVVPNRVLDSAEVSGPRDQKAVLTTVDGKRWSYNLLGADGIEVGVSGAGYGSKDEAAAAATWAMSKSDSLVTAGRMKGRTLPLVPMADTPAMREPGAVDNAAAEVSRANPDMNIFVTNAGFGPGTYGSESVTADDVSQSSRPGYWRNGVFTPFTTAQKDRADRLDQQRADADMLGTGGDGSKTIQREARKRATARKRASDRYDAVLQVPASEQPDGASVKLFGTRYSNNGDGTWTTSTYDEATGSFTDGVATDADFDRLRVQKIAERKAKASGTLKSSAFRSGDSSADSGGLTYATDDILNDSDLLDENGDLLDVALDAVVRPRQERGYTVSEARGYTDNYLLDLIRQTESPVLRAEAKRRGLI